VRGTEAVSVELVAAFGRLPQAAVPNEHSRSRTSQVKAAGIARKLTTGSTVLRLIGVVKHVAKRFGLALRND